MVNIFVNLKRFDVPRAAGGICPFDDPVRWIEDVIDMTIEQGLGTKNNARIVYFPPEALIPGAARKLLSYPENVRSNIHLGCQGVFRADIRKGGNFGAFTTNLPAAAAVNLHCEWAMIGHSEERRDKAGVLELYAPGCTTDPATSRQATAAQNRILNMEIRCAVEAGLQVLYCVGETAEERGDGSAEDQKRRTEDVIRRQLTEGLDRIEPNTLNGRLAIGYEPVWAIGPGKTPPGAAYIHEVSSATKSILGEILGFECPVVYGGGLKEENAAEISSVPTIDGGLIALTRFTGEIGFEPEGMKRIIEKYLA